MEVGSASGWHSKKPPPIAIGYTLRTNIEKKKSVIEEEEDRFIPEIDWDTIMVEIIRSTSNSEYDESDADSIYTDATVD